MKKILIILSILIIILGCDREIPNPVINPDTPEVPATPTSLNMEVADRELELSWSISDTTSITKYIIYFADSLSGAFEVYDSSDVRTYTATGLRNAQTYFFKVSAVSADTVEGKKSSTIYGKPNLYSMVINSGLEQTSDRHVTLTMVAPTGTSLFRIANDTLFTDSPWEAFAGTKSWILTEDEGEKSVYVMFRDGDGNNTRDMISDNITYQLESYQYTLAVNDDAEKTYSRDVSLRLSVPDGVAYMMIANSNSFANASWESYQSVKEWHISPDVAANGETVEFYATFRDSNGDSIPIVAADSIDLACADVVELYPIYQAEDSYQTVALSWSPSLSNDFDSYRIYRSRGLTTADTVVTTIYDAGTVTYSDNITIDDLPDNTPETISYKIRFYSTYDDSSDSDVIQATLVNNQPPTLSSFIRDISYDVDTASGDSNMSASFGWQRSRIVDFDSYVVYESMSLDTTTADPVFYIYDQSTLSYSINKNNVDTVEVYYYWLKIIDLGGQESDFSAPDSVYY